MGPAEDQTFDLAPEGFEEGMWTYVCHVLAFSFCQMLFQNGTGGCLLRLSWLQASMKVAGSCTDPVPVLYSSCTVLVIFLRKRLSTCNFPRWPAESEMILSKCSTGPQPAGLQGVNSHHSSKKGGQRPFFVCKSLRFIRSQPGPACHLRRQPGRSAGDPYHVRIHCPGGK